MSDPEAALPPELAARMTGAGRGLPDTDWHVPQLYDFLARSAHRWSAQPPQGLRKNDGKK
jgi:N-formylglutamate amidohydrolase